ncbi:MAG: hypothetical protein V3T88_08670 [Nitrosomonadaceae bacterium]
MKFLPGLGVGDLRGSLGGTTASRNTYGSYFRIKVTPVNTNTSAQQLVRQRLANISQAWGGLTANQRLAWIETAPQWSHTNVFGNQSPLTGFNLFVRLNRFLLEIGEAQITDAVQPTSVPGFETLSLTADTTGGSWDAAFTPVIPATIKVLVYATAPLSAGISFVKSEFRLIDTVLTGELTPLDLSPEYIAKFGALPPIGSKSFIRFRSVLIATGQPGAIIQSSAIAI